MRRLATLAVGVALAAALPGSAAAATNVLWAAGHETGDISEWLVNGGAPEVTDSGAATVQRGVVHSGRYAMRLTISGADGTRGDQAIRMFRWRLVEGSLLPAAAHYSVWLYFPRRAAPATFWNLIQWKTKRTSGRVDPVFSLNVANRAGSGAMHFYLYDSTMRRTVATSPRDLPVGRWVQIETFYRWSSARRGRVIVFQDGRVIADVKNVRTELPTHDLNARQWSVNNYTDSLRPSSYALFVDDAAISRGRLGPRSWP